jgi:hypothetical protein
MRVPQVSERIKEAPAQALRGVFAGIGQLLLITDKLRNKTSASQQVPPARAPEPSRPRADTIPAPAPVSSAPTAAAAPAAPAPASAPAAPAAPAASAPAASAPAAARVPAARNFDKTGNVRLLTSAEAAADAKAPAPAARAAPLPNYDELSIASLRARLRNLDPTELRQLVAYEQAHADRADVIAMFERRIAKLGDETSADKRGEAEAEAEIEAREDVEAEVRDDVVPEAEGEE